MRRGREPWSRSPMGRRALAAAVMMVGTLIVSGAEAAEDVRALEKQLADEVYF